MIELVETHEPPPAREAVRTVVRPEKGAIVLALTDKRGNTTVYTMTPQEAHRLSVSLLRLV